MTNGKKPNIHPRTIEELASRATRAKEQLAWITLMTSSFDDQSATDSNRHFIFYRRCMSALKASLALIDLNFYEEAAATVRLAYEHLFHATACTRDPKFFGKLEDSNLQSFLTWSATKERWKTGPKALEETVKNLGLVNVTVKKCAETAQLERVHDFEYRMLSKLGAHASALVPNLLGHAAESNGPYAYPAFVIDTIRTCLNELESSWKLFVKAPSLSSTAKESPESPDHPPS